MLAVLLIALALALAQGTRLWPNLASVQICSSLVLVMLAVVARLLISGLRWALLMGEGAPAGRATMVAGYGWCFLLLQLMPFRTGEASRPIWVKLRGGSMALTASTIVLERLFDAVALSSMLFLTLLIHPCLTALGGVRFWLLMAGGLFMVIAGYWILQRAAVGRHSARRDGWLHDLANAAKTALDSIRRPRDQLVVATLTLASWVLQAAAISTFLMSSHGLPWPTGVILLALINFSGAVMVTPGAIGVFEAVAVLVLTAENVPWKSALVSATVLHASVLLGQVVVAAGGWAFLVASTRHVTMNAPRNSWGSAQRAAQMD
jgi:uncharacterized membrane protein YbhN (UPF0104 family)